MGPRPAISAPLPWLTILAGILTARRGAGASRGLLRLPRSLAATREGKWYIGVLLVIGVAAINTGNNLLYLVVATLLSLIIISGILSEATLRGVKVQRVLPPYLFKGAPTRIMIKVTNTKRRIPSYSFRITELDGSQAGAYVVKLPAGGSTETAAEYTFKSRGVHRLTGLKVSTRFPFGLFTKGKVEEAAEETLVLPSITGRRLPLAARRPASPGSSSLSGKGEGGGLWGLREYTLVDDARHIHWKSAGRSERLFLKEFEREADERVFVVFENRGPAGELFERKVDEAASTVNAYIEAGYSVGLRTLSSDIPPAPGRAQLIRVLSELALIAPDGPEGTPSITVVSR